MGKELPLWMGAAPDYEVDENGNMRIVAGDFCLVMPISVFLVGCAKGRDAIAKWERERRPEGIIVPFPTSG